ncbi:MAG TPA: hypothetical protein PLN53_12110 [Terricaulis sp.]|nr:hypothetical protein [Terricaulis sp.]
MAFLLGVHSKPGVAADTLSQHECVSLVPAACCRGNMRESSGVACVTKEKKIVFGWLVILALCALIAATLGFVALAGMMAFVAKLVFLLALALMVISLVSHFIPHDGRSTR